MEQNQQKQTNSANNGQKKRIRRTKEQRLAELQRKAKALEKDIKENKDKKLTRQKIILGGWIISAMRKNPAVIEAAVNAICQKLDIDAPRVDFDVLRR